MACVRDVFYVPPKTTSQKRLRRPVSGPVNQWVEWMEWSSMHGLEHFLIYSTPSKAPTWLQLILWNPILMLALEAGFISSFFTRSRWLVKGTSWMIAYTAQWIMQNGSQQAWMDEYLVIPGEVKYFDGGHILKEQGQNCRSWSSKCSFCTSTSRHLWDFISSLGSQSRSAEAVHKHWQRLSNLDRLPYTVQGLWKWIQSLQASIITGSQGGTWTMNI